MTGHEAIKVEISVPKEFNFAQNWGYLARWANECMLHVADTKIYKLMPYKEGPLLLEVSEGCNGAIAVVARGQASPADLDAEAAVIRYVREWFDLDTDLAPFYALAQNDALLRRVVDQYHGLRNMGIPDLFEALCWAVLGQQINLTFAYTLKRRFVESFGEHTEWNGRTHWLFPTPERIAALEVDDLTALQISKRRAEYLIGIAKAMAAGTLSKELLLETGNCSDAEKVLTQIRGIGPWTANYALMHCLRFPSAFPIADVGLHNAIKHLMGMENKPTIEVIRELSSGWTNWEAYATFYLWRALY
ncbi:DNA-3-methyladenine glycosylase family protein [Paenibacillus xerothermodurans]|uniref:DNA-3-methyladenine glycosylase family protein n=1 Tax=Paenibacillus xerothermodurans TaxID=1977292 RepID=UPI003C78118D